MVPNVATAKFGTFVFERASVAEIAISEIIFAKTIVLWSSGDIKAQHLSCS